MDLDKNPRARKSAPKTTSAEPAKPKARGIRVRKPKAAAAPAVAPEQVATRAYELWQAGAEGDELEHWLRAERELTSA